MKKILAVCLVVCLSAGVAFATEPCSGAECYGTGYFGAFSKAGNAQGNIDLKTGSNSVAFGANGGLGFGEAKVEGFILNGFGSAGAVGGGGSQGNTITKAETNFASSQSINTMTGTEGAIGAVVDPDGGMYNITFYDRTRIGGRWWCPTYEYSQYTIPVVKDPAGGIAGGYFYGFTAQGSLNVTGVAGNNGGFTGGIAGQGSAGYIAGSIGVAAGPDVLGTGYVYLYWPMFGYNENFIDSYDSQFAGAGVMMNGGSYSISQRVVDPGYFEGLRTDVGAFTTVDSWGYGNVVGGWHAIGGAATMTATPNATASAIGVYNGGSGLNCDYNGNATGFSQVETYTTPGLNGSYVRASSGMSVSSQIGSVSQQSK